MAKFEVVGNVLVIATYDDESDTVERVHLCDPTQLDYQDWMDAWRLVRENPVQASDWVPIEGDEKARIRAAASECSAWPRVANWEED